MRTLVIAAHPDDEVLGCGGTISRLVEDGHEVFILILGEGITSRYKHREEADEDLVQALQLKSRDVAKLLGVQEVFSRDFPDNRFDTVPLLDIIKVIETSIAELGPQVVYTQFGGDLNIDHKITFRATLTATRPEKDCPVKEVYAYEVPSSTEWSFNQFQLAFQPNLFSDISSTIGKKIEAMQLYKDEVRLFPHPRSSEAILANAQKWGSMIGCAAAEAFAVIRILR